MIARLFNHYKYTLIALWFLVIYITQRILKLETTQEDIIFSIAFIAGVAVGYIIKSAISRRGDETGQTMD